MTNRDKLVAETLWHVDAEAEKRGWDQDGALFAVMIHKLGDGGAVGFLPLPGWEVCLRLASSAQDALRAMIAAWSTPALEIKRAAYPPEELYGVAFINEVWTLRGDDITPETRKMVEQGRLHELPARVEMRMSYCVSTTGEISMLTHERDGIPEMISQDETLSLTGAIPELLSALVKELTS